MSEENNEDLQVINEEVKPEVPWQIEHTKLPEQNLYLLNNSVWTDCVFVVGDDILNQKIAAHKLMLSRASPVFSAMLLGTLAETSDIYVTDIEPEVFRVLLHYIYTGVLDIKDNTHLPGLFMAAQKYMMPALQNLCLKKMREILSPVTACWLYENAILIDDAELKQLAWKVILQRTNEVVEDPSFNDLKYDTILEIVQCDALYLDSEVPLIAACMKWAETKAEKDGFNKTKEALHKILGQILQYLRILSINVMEFTKTLLIYNLFTCEEKILILTKIAYPNNDIDFAENICLELEKRNKTVLEIPGINFITVHDGFAYDNYAMSSSIFESTCDLNLYGTVVNLDPYYDDTILPKHLTVNLTQVDSNKSLDTQLQSDSDSYNTTGICTFKFTSPLNLHSKKKYSITLTYTRRCKKTYEQKNETRIGKNIFNDLSFIGRISGSIIHGMLVKKI